MRPEVCIACLYDHISAQVGRSEKVAGECLPTLRVREKMGLREDRKREVLWRALFAKLMLSFASHLTTDRLN